MPTPIGQHAMQMFQTPYFKVKVVVSGQRSHETEIVPASDLLNRLSGSMAVDLGRKATKQTNIKTSM